MFLQKCPSAPESKASKIRHGEYQKEQIGSSSFKTNMPAYRSCCIMIFTGMLQTVAAPTEWVSAQSKPLYLCLLFISQLLQIVIFAHQFIAYSRFEYSALVKDLAV
ncbi:hypothetical protein FGO68_gene6459 [Halteria grandinella]|uniref:Uncharacterized protein n=1 Tax=Halteria grandinella TaxID=5974 RepID=A0A8J8NDS9_HALGN|nr:hypothetical protein FGO68_gene6459 [Halteria grandinella]